jgi:hypothetical protein
LQEAADVCGGRGRLWVLNAFLVLRVDGSIAIDGDGQQICGWFTGLMVIATADGLVIVEGCWHGGSE